MFWGIALGAACGFVTGGVAGFAVAVLQLRAKRWRNARLVRRGEPPIRDCVLVRWHLPCAVLGAMASGGLTAWLEPVRAIVIGGLAAPAVLCILVVVMALSRMGPTAP